MENVICLLRFRSGRCGKQISVVTKLLHAYLTQTLSRHLMTVAIQKYSSRWISLWADEINCWQRQNTVWTQPDEQYNVGDAEKMRTIFCACVKINTMKITEEKRLSNKWNKKKRRKNTIFINIPLICCYIYLPSLYVYSGATRPMTRAKSMPTWETMCTHTTIHCH